jgi:plastocyanin
MKKTTLFVLLLFSVLSLRSFSTTWTVNVQDFIFSPANLPNVIVGDTIKWQWINGIHTTTSHIIPSGAPVWDEPLHSGNTTFSYVVSVAGNYHYKCDPHFPGMEAFFEANIIGITPISNEVPNRFSLSQNYPNPFNPVTDIKFDIAKSTNVKLTIMNLLGQEVEVLVNQNLTAGTYKADWNASKFPSGIYFYKLEAGEFVDVKKMILVK